jgi:hypothetical protein
MKRKSKEGYYVSLFQVSVPSRRNGDETWARKRHDFFDLLFPSPRGEMVMKPFAVESISHTAFKSQIDAGHFDCQ